MSIASRPRAGFARMTEGTAEDWAILQAFVSERMHWIIGHHGIFQGYYFFEHFGLEKNLRDKYKDHEYYDDCEEFCRKYDQNSFDPRYSSMPRVDVEAVIQRLFSEPKQSIYLVEQ